MKFLVLAYGAEEDWKALTDEERKELLAADEVMKARGDTVAAVSTAAATVTAWDGTPHVEHRTVAPLPAPLAGFGIIEAADLDEAVRLVKDTPCARARGYVELRAITHLSG